MKKRIIDLNPCELVSLACSISMFLFDKYEIEDLRTIRQFLSSICSNISLLEHQYLISKKETNK